MSRQIPNLSVPVPSLVEKRLKEAENFIGYRFNFQFLVGRSELFPNKRDYAFCHYDPHTKMISIVVSPKFLTASFGRQDGVLRHELGHAIDFTMPAEQLEKLAKKHKIVLSSSQERKADDIAKMVWGSPLLYDQDLVQHTTIGVQPRPRHLGN